MSVSEAVFDAVFPLRGNTIAQDHAWLLWRELERHVPWLASEPGAGILPLSGLARGEGVHYVGGRARLTIRLPSSRRASADFLAGVALDLDGRVELGKPLERRLDAAKVVHSPFVDAGIGDENGFLAACREELAQRGMTPELVCGRKRRLLADGVVIEGFSLMLYDLKPEQTLALQEQGIGRHHQLGCGLFVPHKNVAAVGSE